MFRPTHQSKKSHRPDSLGNVLIDGVFHMLTFSKSLPCDGNLAFVHFFFEELRTKQTKKTVRTA